ncbi:MAG TPA: integrin alpha [Planctomycetota bacterium]
MRPWNTPFASLVALGLLASATPTGAQTTVFELPGVPGSGFGTALDTLGDLDGDGFGEFLIGAPNLANGSLNGAGIVTVHSGADARVLYTVRGTRQGEHLGASASAAGDVDADGVPDFVVGAPDARASGLRQSGRVRVFSGRDGSVLHTWEGSRVADFFGSTCDELGDLDGDGHDDVLVGVSGRLSPTGAWVGALLVHSGRDGSVLVRAYGDRVGGLLGEQGTSALGDVNGDGRADFLGTQIGNQMVTRVFSGLDGRELHRLTFVIPSGWFRIAGHLDADLDGAGDYLLGLNGGGGGQTGQVRLFSGRDGRLLREVLGARLNESLGSSVTGVGDLDGDGHGDFVVGLSYADGPAGTQTGELRAYSGRDGHRIGSVLGDRPFQRLGEGLVGGGRDVDGDGYPEVLLSVRDAAGAESVKVISFVPDGLEAFGTGTPGCAGPLTLLANTSPRVGEAGFALHAFGLGPAATALLTSDVARPAGVLRYRVLFHVEPTRVLNHVVLPAPGPSGSLVAPLPIPADPALVGVTLVFQAVTLFPVGTCRPRIATSPGLRLTFQ